MVERKHTEGLIPRSTLLRSTVAGRRASEPLPLDVERLVCRFDPSARRELRKLFRKSDRFFDLARVFPGAAFAIATCQLPRRLRLEAQAQVVEGAALRKVAKTLDMPLWLRRLPPEAFESVDLDLPTSESFTRRIATRLPDHDCESAFWLETVSFAARAAGDDFALWLAEQRHIFDLRGDPAKLFAIFAAYAWHSTVGIGSRAHELIVVPWRPEIAFDTALCAAKSWLNRMRLVVQMQPGVVTDPWLAPGSSGAFDFVPLTDCEQILAEAHAMQNCADQYADRLTRDKCRLFSVRRGLHRIATLEIGAHPREAGVLAITQLKARHNMPASIEVWQAAHAWLSGQPGLKRLQTVVGPEQPFDTGLWGELLDPYRAGHGGAPWISRTPDQTAFMRMDASLAELAKRGSVTSWLFT